MHFGCHKRDIREIKVYPMCWETNKIRFTETAFGWWWNFFSISLTLTYVRLYMMGVATSINSTPDLISIGPTSQLLIGWRHQNPKRVEVHGRDCCPNFGSKIWLVDLSLSYFVRVQGISCPKRAKAMLVLTTLKPPPHMTLVRWVLG